MTAGSRRVAIVTGAARGIGAGVAERFAADGLAVALFDRDADAARDQAERVQQAGGRAIALGVDVADEDAVVDAVDQIADRLGAPTVLVNNAGVLRDNLIFKMSADDWDTVMAVHLRGTFLLSRAAQAHMVDARWGRIVNLSSVSALGSRGQVNYAAAKAGIQGFTKSLALELGPFGVTVNAIAPGFVVTDMTRSSGARRGLDFDTQVEAASQRLAMRRVGQPADIAAAAAFFVRDDASFVTGQILYVAGNPRA